MWEEYSEIIDLVLRLTSEVRMAVRPHLGTGLAKGHGGQAATGDVTFGIDEIAERVVAEFLDQLPDVAYYTEDRGLLLRGNPDYIMIIDPIDGTRPAAAGLESCCVSVAVAPYRPGAEASLTFGDVFLGLLQELKNRATFIGLKGGGTRIEVEGKTVYPGLSNNKELGRLFWTIGFRGRPAIPLVEMLGRMVDISSVDGGCFDLGSATFSISRVVTGEMDVYVDPGQRMADEVEQVRSLFLEVGHGSILNNYPYDVAAALLVAGESGAVVSDAYGRPLDNYPLVPHPGGGQVSTIVAANHTLHRLVLEQVELGMKRLKARYGGAG